MKIIFSRKGFDTTAGGCPSPIVDGRPVSLPIPAHTGKQLYPSATRYRDLADPLPRLVCDLTDGRVRASDHCHHDPDINADSRASGRPPEWRGALGQAAAAQAHLDRQDVGAGDLFLFFGLFREAERCGGRWKFAAKASKRHALFGWLRVGERSAGDAALAGRPWLSSHPHVLPGWGANGTGNNTVYIAADRLGLAGAPDLPGWGTFAWPVPLSAPDGGCAIWEVPAWLDPRRAGVGLSYALRWNEAPPGRIRIPRGQEFVADTAERAEPRAWLADLFSRSVP